jgi:hypothetical protein
MGRTPSVSPGASRGRYAKWVLLFVMLSVVLSGSLVRVAHAQPLLIMYIACPTGPASATLTNSPPSPSTTPCFIADQSGGNFTVAGEYSGPDVLIPPGSVIHAYQAVSAQGDTYSFMYGATLADLTTGATLAYTPPTNVWYNGNADCSRPYVQDASYIVTADETVNGGDTLQLTITVLPSPTAGVAGECATSLGPGVSIIGAETTSSASPTTSVSSSSLTSITSSATASASEPTTTYPTSTSQSSGTSTSGGSQTYTGLTSTQLEEIEVAAGILVVAGAGYLFVSRRGGVTPEPGRAPKPTATEPPADPCAELRKEYRGLLANVRWYDDQIKEIDGMMGDLKSVTAEGRHKLDDLSDERRKDSDAAWKAYLALDECLGANPTSQRMPDEPSLVRDDSCKERWAAYENAIQGYRTAHQNLDRVEKDTRPGFGQGAKVEALKADLTDWQSKIDAARRNLADCLGVPASDVNELRLKRKYGG